MDLYKYYASFSDSFANVAIGEEKLFSGRESILDRIVNDCSRRGIRSFFYFVATNFYNETRIFFSYDGELYELRNLMAYNTLDMEVYSLREQRVINGRKSDSVKTFIANAIFARDGFGIIKHINIGEHVAVLQIDFDQYEISNQEVLTILRSIFKDYFIDEFGEM